MKRKPLIVLSLVLLAVTQTSEQTNAEAQSRDGGPAQARPNILLIVADDLGYADVGFNGAKDIPTPHLDALAKRSLRMTNGYVTHPFCSPTRAGLLSGRYQQRFGHENNPAWLPEDTVAGLPLSQTTLPEVLKTVGYATGAVGKWHLGAHPQFHPNRRGFDEYFGLLGGGRQYIPDGKGSAEYTIPMDRNGQKEPLAEYLTDALAREASAFIGRHQKGGQPWLLYLAFNAPHTPLQPHERHLAKVANIADEKRRKYAGLVVGMDEAIGSVLKTLRESGQERNTMIWFFSDNGGPVSVTNSSNGPLRGAKGQVYEGGIRVPFLISWPARASKGKTLDHPVVALDVFATAAALAGASSPKNHQLEGVNLTPYLTGQEKSAPDRKLFWRMGGGGSWAVRDRNWKLVKTGNTAPQLFDLSTDIGETKDVATQQPAVAARLQAAFDEWNKQNIAPLFKSAGASRRPR